MSKVDRFMMATGIMLGCLEDADVAKELRLKGIDTDSLEKELQKVVLATIVKQNSEDEEG